MKIGIGNDHTGVELKKELTEYLEAQGYEVINYGTDSTESYDYPLAGEKVAKAVVNKEVDLGIGICGTGIGIGLAANKVAGIRCATCSEPYSAKMARMHNNANMISFGSRVVGPELAKMIVDEWLKAEFIADGGRHCRRVAEIMDIEKRNREK